MGSTPDGSRVWLQLDDQETAQRLLSETEPPSVEHLYGHRAMWHALKALLEQERSRSLPIRGPMPYNRPICPSSSPPKSRPNVRALDMNGPHVGHRTPCNATSTDSHRRNPWPSPQRLLGVVHARRAARVLLRPRTNRGPYPTLAQRHDSRSLRSTAGYPAGHGGLRTEGIKGKVERARGR